MVKIETIYSIYINYLFPVFESSSGTITFSSDWLDLEISKIRDLCAALGTKPRYKGMFAMGALVRNLSHIDGRWKFRKIVPVRLRPHIDGSITEFVRWLGEGSKASPEVMSAYAKASSECEQLFALATKQHNGDYDELSDQALAPVIAAARRHELFEDAGPFHGGDGETL